MNLTSNDFSLHALEGRFEMQRFVLNEACDIDCGGGGGSDYGYYGNSWDNRGAGDAYVGPYQQASDGSGAVLDDGTYTDGSSGAFPTYETRATLPPNPSCFPTYPCSPPSLCRICRC
jgi:hypothetical protein